MKFKSLFITFAIAFFAISSSALFAANSPVGTWKTIDDETKKVKSIVEIYEKNGVVFGKIVKLIGESQDTKCDKCKGSKFNKPIVGMVFVWGMKKDGDKYEDGKILDPKNGKTYTCKMWIEDGNLKVRGYIGFFYRTQTWYKVK